MGHFGPRPIRRAWFLVVFPALTLNYLGQAALVERDPSAREGTFYLLVPSWALVPMVVLATAATVIASQAVIAGAFSVSHQAMRMGFLPRMRLVHTSSEEAGQVYVPAVNAVLFAAVLVVMVGFGSSARLAGAYGVAVTATFTITTVLLLAVARERWRWSTGRLVLLGSVLGVLESTYLAANLTKVAHGGWLTLLVAATVFTVMATWRRGRELLVARRTEAEGSLQAVVTEVRTAALPRVPGIAVYPHPTGTTAPLALRATIDRFTVVHRCVVVMTGRTTAVPHVPWEERITVEPLGEPADGFLHVSVSFGFRDVTDFPEALRRALGPTAGPDGVDGEVTWFLSSLSLRPVRRPGTSRWRKRLFIALTRGAAGHGYSLHLPGGRTVVMGADLEI
jgi:KUP system potassium uptake protein